MKKKVIALADNSYTIRRIVELSFSEIENIEVHSFENGAGLKEKLLQLAPDVVIVDIKLPEINGYDICYFINSTPALSRCRVFLMKGSFEAVDNEMIKNLTYEDIVTKPFDSNALVSSVMKKISQEEQKAAVDFPEEEPSSFPEDIIEIEPEATGSEGISFSDLRLDLGSPAPRVSTSPPSPVLEREEILPSEEITQGTQPIKDALMAPDNEEVIHNPFSEEPLAEDMKLSSSELISPPEPPPAAAVQAPFSENLADEFPESPKQDEPSEHLLKPSLEATRMAARNDLDFPISREDELFSIGADTAPGNADAFEGTDPVKTMFSEKDEIFDFVAASQKQGKEKGPAASVTRPVEEQGFVQKVRPETISPEAELEKLSPTAHKETKSDGGLSIKDKLDLTGKLEDKLTLTIKELIWEIVPSLAEKIIKEEIDKIKSEANNTGF